jgi:glycine cleavage system aminomethyltransferase T
MPHWNGWVKTTSPPLLEPCNGNFKCVRDTIIASSPPGANVKNVSMKAGETVALVTVEGPGAKEYLEKTLEASDIVELASAREREIVELENALKQARGES